MGEPRFRKGKHTDSGFVVAIGEAETWDHLRDRIVAGTDKLRALVLAARRAGAEANLDFAIFVGGVPFTSSLSFTAADLTTFAKLGVSLAVSAYPVSDSEPTRRRHHSKLRKKGGPRRAAARVPGDTPRLHYLRNERGR